MSVFGSRRPKPHQVFTPGSPPLEEHNVYVERAGAEKALRKAVERRWVPVVWGEYGVGKTSLVLRFFQREKEEGRLVYISSVADLTLPDVFRTILEHLNYAVDVESTVADTAGVEAGINLKVVTAKARGATTDTRKQQFVVTSPTDTALNNLLRESKLTVVLDETHKASEEMRAALANWIKATRTGGAGFTLVLVGTSTDAGRLVALDPGIDRYVKEMAVDLMSTDEAEWIVDEGLRRLGLTISSALRGRLVQSAAGAPTIVQALCLDASEAAIEQGRDEVIEADVRSAVDAYLEEHGGRLYDHYTKAIETTGPRRYRKQVLRAVAMVPNDYATMDDIRGGVSAGLGEDVPAQSLSGPLRDLKTPEYGKILKDVDREVSGARIHNLTAFSDPMMKSFVRFINNLDQTGLMAKAPQQK
jgi:hypothetical protein